MSISIEYLEEPKLCFGDHFRHQDTKTGLAEYGPFGKNIEGLHPSEVRLGFIGNRESITGAKEWISECGNEIESENTKQLKSKLSRIPDAESLFGDGLLDDDEALEPKVRFYKILNRDFIGFSKQSEFDCCFQMNDRWDRVLTSREIEQVLAVENDLQRIQELVDLFTDKVRSLAETSPAPTVIILALTTSMTEKAYTADLGGGAYFNFRRAVKASGMAYGVPLQLLQRSTVLGKKPKGREQPLQEKATRAWNFCTAQYYKAEGIPWCPVDVEADTCFVGVDFYFVGDEPGSAKIRTSVAQAFDYLGQGLVLRGDPFDWKPEQLGRTPHLTYDAAQRLIEATLNEYVNLRGVAPRRVVIHKRSRFWDESHGEYNERQGFIDGIESVSPRCDYDLVTLARSRIRLFREGQYPPARGTYFSVDGSRHLLYTMGFIPFLETYPGVHVPEPWEIIEHHGGSGPKELFREVLQLTKMNVNNCSFADGTPITLSFSGKIGEIMKHIGEDDPIQTSYRHYM